MNRHMLLAFLLLACANPSPASDTKASQGAALLEKAVATSDIFALRAFEMKATVSVNDKGNPLSGSYTLLWNGPDQWREELVLPGYSEIRVGGKGVIHLKRNPPFIPLPVDEVHRTLSYGRGLIMPRAKETVKGIHTRKVNDVKSQCAEIVDRERHTREVCVDPSTNALLRQAPFVDKELSPLGEKMFPRFLSYVENGKTVAEVRISELKLTEPAPSSAFDIPVGADSKRGCWNPTVGSLVKSVNAVYPILDRQSHVEGTVVIYSPISADGVPHDLRIVSGLNPSLNQASLNAIQQWRYEPMTCDGIPVEGETVALVRFWMQTDF